jgi:hypothetical protein
MRRHSTGTAVLAWRTQPARARKAVLQYFRDEAQQSDAWARHEREMGREGRSRVARDDEYRRHREDAAAIRAALAVLKAAARRPRKAGAVSSKKRRA